MRTRGVNYYLSKYCSCFFENNGINIKFYSMYLSFFGYMNVNILTLTGFLIFPVFLADSEDKRLWKYNRLTRLVRMESKFRKVLKIYYVGTFVPVLKAFRAKKRYHESLKMAAGGFLARPGTNSRQGSIWRGPWPEKPSDKTKPTRSKGAPTASDYLR